MLFMLILEQLTLLLSGLVRKFNGIQSCLWSYTEFDVQKTKYEESKMNKNYFLPV
jgi:hypothetical protein